jgi:uncharacterized protein with HEPN domain
MKMDNSQYWRDIATVSDIVDAGRKIHNFIAGFDEGSFAEDEKTVSSVMYQLTVIGEAATWLSEPFKDKYSDVPWRQIVATRNFLIHVYDQVNLKRVWNTATIHVPELVETSLEPLLPAK